MASRLGRLSQAKVFRMADGVESGISCRFTHPEMISPVAFLPTSPTSSV